MCYRESVEPPAGGDPLPCLRASIEALAARIGRARCALVNFQTGAELSAGAELSKIAVSRISPPSGILRLAGSSRRRGRDVARRPICFWARSDARCVRVLRKAELVGSSFAPYRSVRKCRNFCEFFTPTGNSPGMRR